MNIVAPVSSIMSTRLITVNPDDNLEKVKACFDENNIHHLPVVRYKQIVGIISSTDFNHFLRGFTRNEHDSLLESVRLRAWKAEDIMTEGLAKVETTDPIRTILEVFKTNRIHALPVEQNNELVGIVTTYDIIGALAEEPIQLEDYKQR
ncbi:MAG: CBS domain-containing protein [Bacteroidota bacterium]